MSSDRIARALARIEAASGRIERAAPRAEGADPEMSRNYARLQGEAANALAEIDRLIAAMEA